MLKKLNGLFVALFVAFFFSSAYADDREPLCMRWQDKNNLSFWRQKAGGGRIELGRYGNKDVIKIHRANKGTSFITRKIEAEFDGDYTFMAVVKGVDIEPGVKHYERGKFQVILFDRYGRNLSAKRNYYPHSDFYSTDSWETLVFSVENVMRGQIMEMRFGLQGARGTVYLADFEHCYIPPSE